MIAAALIRCAETVDTVLSAPKKRVRKAKMAVNVEEEKARIHLRT